MRHECGWSSAGFSLIEVVVSIAILGMAVIPISGGMVLSHRLNARSEQVLQARLEVSGAVEALMAEGIAEENDYSARFPSVTVELGDPEESGGAIQVTVTSRKEQDVSVQTFIRPAPAETPEGGGSP